MRLAVFLALCAFACGGGRPDRTCGPEDFIYTDTSCGPAAGSACTDRGDGLCHLRCESDQDCPGHAPFCRTLGLYLRGDYNCNDSVRICRETAAEDCPYSAGRR